MRQDFVRYSGVPSGGGGGVLHSHDHSKSVGTSMEKQQRDILPSLLSSTNISTRKSL